MGRKIFLGVVCGGLIILSAVLAPAEEQGQEKIVLSSATRGDVLFAHRLHQETLADCMVCHSLFPKVAGAIEKLKTEGTLVNKQVMDTCRACHKEKKASGDKAGPIICSGCHTKK